VLIQVPVLMMQGIKRGDFDDMISCDNNDCPIGWFYYSCLKLTEEDVLKGKYTVQNAIRRSL